MIFVRSIAVISLVLLLCVSAFAMDIEKLMERHAKAMGGMDALNSIETARTVSTASMAGMTGQSIAWYQAPDKYRDEIVLPVATISRIANGDEYWTIDMGGQLRRMTGEEVREIKTALFITSGDYLDRKNWGESVQYIGEETVDSVTYYKVLIQPQDGLESTVFLDPETYLIAFSDVVVQMFSIRTYQTDYREIDGIMVPFKFKQDAGIPQLNADMTVVEHEFNIDLADTLFEPQFKENERAYITDGTSVTVEFDLRVSHIYVPVMVNGQGPFRFVLDSGAGLSLIEKSVADRLNLHSTGELPAVGTGGVDIGTFVTADSVNLGGAILKDVVAGQLDFSGLNQFAQEPIEGILGYDFFSSFIVELDYFDSTITVYDNSASETLMADDTVSIEIETNHPMISALINDSIEGRFRIDTGSMNYLDLNTHFVAEHNLIEQSESTIPGVKIHGVGGGEIETILGRVGSFSIGEFTIDDLPCGFSTSDSGIFAAEANDGNIGGGVLSRFTCTFDYTNERLLLTPNENLGVMDEMVSAGVVLGKSGDFVLVSQILSGSSAQDKGVEIGDTILTIDGIDTRNMELFKLHEILNAEESNKVTIELVGSEGKRTVILDKKALF